MFAGKDCTRALGQSRVRSRALHRRHVEGLDQDELDKLEEWIEMFEGKYRRIGRLLSERIDSRRGDDAMHFGRAWMYMM